MGRKKSRSNEQSQDNIVREILAALLFSIGLFSSLSLIFYSSKSGFDVKGAMGTIGVFISSTLGNAFGVIAFVVPIVMFYTAVLVFANRTGSNLYRRITAGLIFLIVAITFLGLIFGANEFLGYSPAGGWIGSEIAAILKDSIAGTVGSYLITTILLLISLIIITSITLSELMRYTGNIILYAGEGLRKTFVVLYANSKKLAAKIKTAMKTDVPDIATEPLISSGNGSLAINSNEEPPIELIEEVREPLAARNTTTEQNTAEQSNVIQPQIVVEQPKFTGLEEFSPTKALLHKDYKLPPTELLDPKQETKVEIDKDAVYKQAKLIEDKLSDFGVSGKITEIRPGPVITMFEYKPAPGIKINKIAALDNDLAMGLSALSIRIIAPIPGKDVIGIEVPNAKRELVVLRELLEDPGFSKSKSTLTIEFVETNDLLSFQLFEDVFDRIGESIKLL